MTDRPNYDPVRLRRALCHIGGVVDSIDKLGPHAVARDAPRWLLTLTEWLVQEVEAAFPDRELFEKLTSISGQGGSREQVLSHLKTCWDVSLLLSVMKGALAMFEERGPAGFHSEAK